MAQLVLVPRAGGLALILCVTIQLAALAPISVLTAASSASGLSADALPTTTSPRPSNELALAAALVDALNRGDEDRVVALFDPEATLRMDRFAWTHYEIRLWARAQIGASIVVEREGPIQAVPNRAMWTTRVGRDDWRERDVQWVRMANRILTEDDRIMDFSADPLDDASITPLGNLWRPGSTPDRTPPVTPGHGVDQSAADGQAPAAPLTLLACVVVSLFVVGGARRLRSGATPNTHSRALVAQLGDWQRQRQGGG
jgi:hypothetical protein